MKGLRFYVFAGVLASSFAFAQTVAVHDPWLNWDLLNDSGQDVNDFHICVDTPNWSPSESFNDSFGAPTTLSDPTTDCDGDGDQDTIVVWSGGTVPDQGYMHAGMYMQGSGDILNAYWTVDGIQVSAPLPVTYELTLVEEPPSGDPEIWMRLAPPTMLVTEYPVGAIGWSGIRTFIDIDAADLGLSDLNDLLDLNSLPSGTETAPENRDGIPLVAGDTYWVSLDSFPAESFFDVFVGSTLNTGPEYESLLYAEVWLDPDVNTQGDETPIGEFWNLNPQSPEPSTAVCLLLASLGWVVRRRRR